MFRATGLTGWQRNLAGDAGTADLAPSGSPVEPDVEMLKRQAADLERTLGALKSRIQAVEASAAGQAPAGKEPR